MSHEAAVPRPRRATKPPRAWQRMLSGRRLDLLDPSPLAVEFGDVAHGLARVARWNGQTRGPHPYSVAQHSLLVGAIFASREQGATPAARLSALLHDAPEYCVGDLISPFKAVVGEGYVAVEARLAAAIRLRAGLPAVPDARLAAAIKRCDRIAAHFEAVALAGFSRGEADAVFGRPPLDAARFASLLDPWTATRAQRAYLAGLREAGFGG